MKHEELYSQIENENFRKLLLTQHKYHLSEKESLSSNLSKIADQREPVNLSETYNLIVAYIQHHCIDKKDPYVADQASYALRDITRVLLGENASKGHSTPEGQEVLKNLKQTYSLLCLAMAQGSSVGASIDKHGFRRIFDGTDLSNEHAIWALQQIETFYTMDTGDISFMTNQAAKNNNSNLQRYIMTKGAQDIIATEKGIESICHMQGTSAQVFFDGLSDEGIKKVANYIIKESTGPEAERIERPSASQVAMQCIERFGSSSDLAKSVATIIANNIQGYMNGRHHHDMSMVLDRWGDAPTVFKALWATNSLVGDWSEKAFRASMPNAGYRGRDASRQEFSASDIQAFVESGLPLVSQSSHNENYFSSILSISSDEVAVQTLKMLTPEQIEQVESNDPGTFFREASRAFMYSQKNFETQIAKLFISKAPQGWSTDAMATPRYSDDSIDRDIAFFIALAKLDLINIDAKLYGHTPLQAALATGNMEAAKEFVQKGGNINERLIPEAGYTRRGVGLEFRGTTPVVGAVKSGNANLLNQIFDLGADPYTKAETGANLAQLCSGKEHLKEIIKVAKAAWGIQKEMQDAINLSNITPKKKSFSPL